MATADERPARLPPWEPPPTDVAKADYQAAYDAYVVTGRTDPRMAQVWGAYVRAFEVLQRARERDAHDGGYDRTGPRP